MPTLEEALAAAERRCADLRQMVEMEKRAQAAELRAEKAEVEAKLLRAQLAAAAVAAAAAPAASPSSASAALAQPLPAPMQLTPAKRARHGDGGSASAAAAASTPSSAAASTPSSAAAAATPAHEALVREVECHPCSAARGVAVIFATRKIFEKHHRAFHRAVKRNAGKPNACDHCAAYFDSAAALAVHCNDQHAAHVRPHACTTCAMSFASTRTLAFHEALHHAKELGAGATSRRRRGSAKRWGDDDAVN